VADPRAIRIVDANCNRAREALRVIEDIVRFCREDVNLTRRLKRERHAIARYCDGILKHNLKGIQARNVEDDPGKTSMPVGEMTRRNFTELLIANFRRAEESLRVLEEVAKLIDPHTSQHFKRSRFRVYQMEQSCLSTMGPDLEKN
jgi:thiamine-phosphate pyrophosphorylase